RPGQEKQRLGQIEELASEEQDLSKQLRRADSRVAPPGWAELADVRKALAADAVLIDIAHFRNFNFKVKPRQKKWLAARYAAWVTPPSGPVRLIDLGLAEKIDEAVTGFRGALKDASKQVKGQGEEKAEKALRRHLEALSKLVLEPLLPHIGKSK